MKVGTIKQWPNPGIVTDSEVLLPWVRENFGSRALLAFSRGKDSLAAWIQLRRFFDEVIPCFCYLVPGLEFEEESLEYYEKYFQTKIYRWPHPSLNRMLKLDVFQPPDRVPIIAAARLPEYTYEDNWADICEQLGIDVLPSATGVRAVDSPLRMMAYRKYGLWRPSSKGYLPIGDWNKKRVMEEINAAGLKLPADYEMFGRSFDGIDYRFTSQLKKHRPRDYQKVLEWFPMLELDIFRYERMGFRP